MSNGNIHDDNINLSWYQDTYSNIIFTYCYYNLYAETDTDRD